MKKMNLLIKAALILLVVTQSAFAEVKYDDVRRQLYRDLSATPNWSTMTVPEKRNVVISRISEKFIEAYTEPLLNQPELLLEKLNSGQLPPEDRIAIYRNLEKQMRQLNSTVNTAIASKEIAKSALDEVDLIGTLFLGAGAISALATATDIVWDKKYGKTLYFRGKYAGHMMITSFVVAIASLIVSKNYYNESIKQQEIIKLKDETIQYFQKIQGVCRQIFQVLDSQIAAAADEIILGQAAAESKE